MYMKFLILYIAWCGLFTSQNSIVKIVLSTVRLLVWKSVVQPATGASTPSSLLLNLGRWTGGPAERWWLGGLLWLTAGPSQKGWQSCTACPSECRPLFTFEAHSESKLRFNSTNIPVVTSGLTEGGEPNKYKTCWRKGSVSVKHYWDGIHTLYNSSVYCVQFDGFQHI